MVVCVLCHAGGASLFTIEKSYLQFEKIKIEKIKKSKRIEKKAMYRLKNKKLRNVYFTNESLPVPYVIDQCSRGDRRCG